MLLMFVVMCLGACCLAFVIFLAYQGAQPVTKPTGPVPVGARVGNGVGQGGGVGNDVGLGGGAGGALGSFGKMPAWAQKGATNVAADASYAENKQTMAALNNSGKQIDFLLYGDSITRYLAIHTAVWKRHFGSWVSAPMGVGGNTIEQLGWRMMSGNERPSKPPKCIALLIGVNNSPATFQQSVARLEELVRWLQRAYPSTKLVLMALLPATRGHNNPKTANPVLRQMAQRANVTFAECGQAMNPSDTRLYSDQLHPTAAGYDVVLPCLKKIVESVVS